MADLGEKGGTLDLGDVPRTAMWLTPAPGFTIYLEIWSKQRGYSNGATAI
jgi:hypothetical protein